jgi:hypothetical protein
VNHVSVLRSLAAIAALAFASGCAPSLTLVTPPPPNRVITVDREHDRLDLSEGVAVAVECFGMSGPCKDMKAISTSPEILGVYPAHFANIGHTAFNADTNVANLAIVGMKPGRTTLRVWSNGYSREYVVTVLPAEGVSKGAIVR